MNTVNKGSERRTEDRNGERESGEREGVGDRQLEIETERGRR